MKMTEPILAVMLSSNEERYKELTRDLKPEDVEIDWVITKKALLEYLQETQPQTIILEHPLLGVSLIGTIQAIHDISKDSKIPILVLSNLERSRNASILNAGADDLMEKPFTTTGMVARLKNLVKRYESAQKQ